MVPSSGIILAVLVHWFPFQLTSYLHSRPASYLRAADRSVSELPNFEFGEFYRNQGMTLSRALSISSFPATGVPLDICFCPTFTAQLISGS